MSYQHLTQHQRYQIATLHKANFASRYIANVINCHHSAVARELQRNRKGAAYHAATSQQKAVKRRRVASSRTRIDAANWAIVEGHLRVEWSPQQSPDAVASRSARNESINTLLPTVSVKVTCGPIAADVVVAGSEPPVSVSAFTAGALPSAPCRWSVSGN